MSLRVTGLSSCLFARSGAVVAQRRRRTGEQGALPYSLMICNLKHTTGRLSSPGCKVFRHVSCDSDVYLVRKPKAYSLSTQVVCVACFSELRPHSCMSSPAGVVGCFRAQPC